MSWFLRRLDAARMQSDRSGGFSLIEVIVALGLILLVMTSSVVFFVNSLHTSAGQQSRQAAISVADQAIEVARAVPVANLVDGRDQATADAQWTALPAGALAAKTSSKEMFDTPPVAATPSRALHGCRCDHVGEQGAVHGRHRNRRMLGHLDRARALHCARYAANPDAERLPHHRRRALASHTGSELPCVEMRLHRDDAA